jgi:hypothetical protein
MITVRVINPVPGMEELSRRVQRRFYLTSHTLNEACILRITSLPDSRLFRVKRNRGVLVSTWQSQGICLYAGLPESAYFVTAAVLGLVQYRTLTLNPLLVEEDFQHNSCQECMFANREYKEDFALAFDELHVCTPCLEFYRSLGAEPEIGALLDTLRRINRLKAKYPDELLPTPIP